jgi:NAD-dependent dihydropyrimidine dehydrogenase PreA subunit
VKAFSGWKYSLDYNLYTVYKNFVKAKRHGVARARKEYPVYLIKVDSEKCTGCGWCMELCPVDVFEMKKRKSIPVRTQNCLGCGTCTAVCDTGAIVVTEI